MKALLVLATLMTGMAAQAGVSDFALPLPRPGNQPVTCTAQGRNGGLFQGEGRSVPEATNNALAKCQTQGNPPCRIVRCN